MREDRKEFIDKMKKRLLLYSKRVVLFVDSLPRDLSSQILAKQLLRCATSIAANFVEAQAAPTKKDFTNFLSIALKSANETLFWLALFQECGKGNKDIVIELQRETMEFANYLGSSIRTLRS